MATTSPAALLRAAADTLRALATAASTDERGGPTARWHFTERNSHGSGYLYAANPDGPGARLIHGGSSGPHGRGTRPSMDARHGEYAAAVDPAVGLALADWLAAAADAAELAGPDPRAVAVARQLLGEDTDRA